MAALYGPITLAPVGSTSNNTHTGQKAGDDTDRVGLVFVVEAVGGTPTVTVQVQGTYDPDEIIDANAKWFILPVVDSTGDTIAVTKVYTTVANNGIWVANAMGNRFARRYRIVTTANTNVTYSCQMWQVDKG